MSSLHRLFVIIAFLLGVFVGYRVLDLGRKSFGYLLTGRIEAPVFSSETTPNRSSPSSPETEDMIDPLPAKRFYTQKPEVMPSVEVSQSDRSNRVKRESRKAE